MDQDEQTISAADVGDVAAVFVDGPAPRDVRPLVKALTPAAEAVASATGADGDVVLGVALALGEFGITRDRALAIAAAVARGITDPLLFLETCRTAYNAAVASHTAHV